MIVKVAINGFGRIGRLVFRQTLGAEGYEVVATNNLTSPKMLAHLLKYGSTQGTYAKVDIVITGKGSITVDRKGIITYAEADTENLPWGKLDVDVVPECVGFYISKDKASVHIEVDTHRVVIFTPAGNDLPTVVFNINHNVSKLEDTVISTTSYTINRLTPMAKTLNDLAPVQNGIMSTAHAYTGDQMTLDEPRRKGDLRRSRAAVVNIVLDSTGAARAIGLVIPELKDKLVGSVQCIPTPTGSTTILVAVVKGKITIDEVSVAVKAASNESFGYTTNEIVPSDVIGMHYGSLFDVTQTMAMEMEDGNTQVQVVSWYDNEDSYTNQMVRTIKFFSGLA